MYNAYFGFSESPFEVNLDQRFLFLCEDHTEVLAALLYFVKEKKGLALVCGDVGTGKTMLINSFLSRLPNSVQPIIISNPLVSYRDLLYFIAGALGISDKSKNLLELIEQIKEALLEGRRQGQNFVLIVDEAHLFSDASLEQVRLLSNIEIPEGKLLQILLVGQYELTHKLIRPEMRQLRQRINISRFLSPLTQSETVAYIDYRLQKVGANFLACFEPTCDKLLYQLTEGVPRRINQLCDNALLHCMADGLKKVNRQVLQQAQEALLTDVILTHKAPPKIATDAILTPKAPPKIATANWKTNKSLIPLAVCACFLVLVAILDLAHYFQDRTALESTREVKVKVGDNLAKIAAEWYPKNVDLGLAALLLANPETANVDLISPGQKLNLPLINPANLTISLKENLLFGFYGSYASMPTLQETISRLGHQGVRYVVLSTKDDQGRVTHRVLIGGYEGREDLEKALQRSQATPR